MTSRLPLDLVFITQHCLNTHRLRAIVDRFLAHEAGGATLVLPRERCTVRDFEAFFQIVTGRARRPIWHSREGRWLLLGPARERGQ